VEVPPAPPAEAIGDKLFVLKRLAVPFPPLGTDAVYPLQLIEVVLELQTIVRV
jgi:hypothetical protein